MIKRGVISVSVTRVPADSLFQPGILELFSADTTYSLHGTLTNLDGSSIYLWRTYNLGHLIALARSLSDRLPKNELVLRKTKINNLQKYELFMKCKPEESARLLTQMKALGFLRAHR
jgi:hypothetical protein